MAVTAISVGGRILCRVVGFGVCCNQIPSAEKYLIEIFTCYPMDSKNQISMVYSQLDSTRQWVVDAATRLTRNLCKCFRLSTRCSAFTMGMILTFPFASAESVGIDNPTTKTLVYKTLPDGTSLDLDLDLPARALAPVMLYVHSWSGSKNQLKPYSSRLAADGVAGVRINYRKLSEGHSFAEAYSDVSDALSWIWDNADRYGIDMNHWGIAGASAGGLLSAILALESPDCQIYIGFNGGYDLVGRDGSRWPPEQRMEHLLGNSEPMNCQLKHWSPIYRIQSDHQPAVLLLHGTADEIITFPVAKRFYQALEKSGASVELIPFEGEVHGFFNASRPSFEEIFSYVRKHVETHLHRQPDSPMIGK